MLKSLPCYQPNLLTCFATACFVTLRTSCSHRQSGKPLIVEEYLKQALHIHRELGSRQGEAAALGNLAIVYQNTGRLELAEQTCEQALQILREMGERRGEGDALANLAIVYQTTGRMELAEQTYEQTLQISREVGNRHNAARLREFWSELTESWLARQVDLLNLEGCWNG